MALPTSKEIEKPLLIYIYMQGGEACTADCYKALAKELQLTNQQINAPISKDDLRPKWENIIRFARLYLVKEGLLLNAQQYKRGFWKLTDSGTERAKRLINAH